MRLIRILLCFLALAAQPAFAASSPALASVEQQLSYLLANRSADVGVAALDLSTGQTLSVNGDKRFPLASTIKIAVAAAYLAQVDHGRRSLDDRIGSRTAAQLMNLMMTRSDNGATDLLIRDLGGPASVQQWLSFNNIAGLRIDRTIAQLLASPRDLWEDRDSGTPQAMVELLRKLDRGNILMPETKSYLLRLMSQCMTGKNRMRALLPAGTPVQHKTGTLSGYASDVGFITLPDGRRVAVAIFARGGTDRPRTIAEAARTLYDGFTSALRAPFAAASTYFAQ